jgi:hypothetical protein
MTERASAKAEFIRSIQELEKASSPAEVEEVLYPWLKRGPMLYALDKDDFICLQHAAKIHQLWSLWHGLRSSLENYVETLPETRERRAAARSKTLEAISDPEALLALGESEWEQMVAIAHEAKDHSLVRSLRDARRIARDAQPHLTAAHCEVQAALNNPAALVTLSKREYSALLKTAAMIPCDYGGLYNNYRQAIIELKTKAIIFDRIHSTPWSNVMHLGVRGAFTLELVRRIDRLIEAHSWCTVPRVFSPNGRKQLGFVNGEPETGYTQCDSFGSFYRVPDIKERSTSIVCRRKEATILKIHDETIFDLNIDTELEEFFRSKSPFPWESEGIV